MSYRDALLQGLSEWEFQFLSLLYFFCLSIIYGWRAGAFEFFVCVFRVTECVKKPHLGKGGVWVGKKSRCVIYKIYHVLQNPSLVYTASLFLL